MSSIRTANALRIINSVETVEQFMAISDPWVRSLKHRVRESEWLEICHAMLIASVRAAAGRWGIPGPAPESRIHRIGHNCRCVEGKGGCDEAD